MAEKIEAEAQLLLTAIEFFQNEFGTPPEIAAGAPGRVNLIGEHTDYNEGFVLPMALPLITVMVGKENGLSRCRVVTAAAVDKPDFVEFLTPEEGCTPVPSLPKWANYVIGVCSLFRECPISSFDAAIVSSVPVGGGLSSSAALETCTYTFLENLTQRFTENVQEKALICQQAEHQYAGVPCGIMDQFVASMAKPGHALLIDCRSLTVDLIPFNPPEIRSVIINSNVRHDLANSEYAERKEMCAAAARILKKASLRDASLPELHTLMQCGQIDEIMFRRAHHVISEIERTTIAVCCLRTGNYDSFGQLMYQSHNSLAHDYEVSCPELDQLVEIAKSVDGVYGSRMTGAGFGGCTITLVHKECVSKLIEKVKSTYSGKPTIYVVKASDCTRVLDLEAFVSDY